VTTPFFSKQASRREIMKAGSALAGGSLLFGLLPRNLLAQSQSAQSSQSGQAAQPSQAAANLADRISQMKAQAANATLQTTKLTDNLYMISGAGGNMVALDGPDGKVLVDTSFATVATKLKQALDAISSAPFKIAINTHWHFDHTDSNEAVHGNGAMILAHENTRKRLSTAQHMAALGLDFPPSPAAALPQQTFADAFKLYFDGEELSLGYFTPAHTDTDIYVQYASGNVLHMGDIWFNGTYPLIDASTKGNIDGMIAASTRGMGLADANTKIVPGHGPLGDKAGLTKYRDMLVTVRDRVRALKAAGKSLQEAVAAKPTADLDATWGQGFINGDFFTTLVYSTL
jgi:cyclase